MNQRNASNKPQAVKINITIPLPDTQAKSPTKPPCSNCSACGKCGQPQSPLLQHAGNILFNMLGDKYPPEKISSALEVLDALLRKHYSHQ